MSDLLDEIKNKLNKMLDNNLNICQHYSSIVIIMYKTIFTYLNGKVDLDCFRDVLNELIDYVMKEYYSFAKLLSYDKNTLMSKIDVHIQNEDGNASYSRFCNKVRFMKNIFDGYKISSSELSIDNIPSDMDFDIYSVMFSLIYIKVFKDISCKLDSLSYGEHEERFVNCLYSEFNFKMIYRCSCNDLFEIVYLFNDLDIKKMPDINMNILLKYLNTIYGDVDINEHINQILYNCFVENVDVMREKKNLENNPNDVFEYLYFITFINVIMSYMNKIYLYKVYNYCMNTKFENLYICRDVNARIKRRIKFEN